MTDYEQRVKALREYSGCRKGEIARITSDAADAIKELEAEKDATQGELDALRVFTDEAQRQIESLEQKLCEIVRCGECKYWSGPVDEVDGNLYGQCERPISAIMPTSFVSSTWYCGDGERKVQDADT